MLPPTATETKRACDRRNTIFSREACVVRDAQRTSNKKMARQTTKPLLPTLKEKKRYLTYQLHGEGLPANAGSLLIPELRSILGVFDAAAAGLLNITYDQQTGRGVIRTTLAKARQARAAMLLTTSLSKHRVMIHPITTSGILNKAKQAM
ncbi:hypothetical protein GF367_00565 [Candidatus Woesearchaeota archaeon]|nr:hypothetical protein [Candidatus Woesearchaeota archaeon]